MTTSKQDSDFFNSVCPNLLENALYWIGRNMSPEDVFSTKELENWAENNGYQRGK